MTETSSRQFGLAVAYVAPGFIGLIGTTPLFPMVAEWLHPINQGEFGVGPTVYALLGATAVGMIVSCVRWLIIDHLHAWTGVVSPTWNFRLLEDRLEALSYLVDNHYYYHLFYSNTLIAVIWAYLIHRLMKTSPLLGSGTDLGALILCVVLFAGSRDALAKYFQRAGQLVGEVAEKDGDVMTNGIGHHEGSTSTPKPPPDKKPQDRAEAPPKSQQEDAKGKKPAK